MDRRKFLANAVSIVAVGAVGPSVADATPITNAKVEFYSLDGMTIFPILDMLGAYSARASCFPMVKRGDSLLIGNVRTSTYEETTQGGRQSFLHRARTEFSSALARGEDYPIGDLDGGPMPAEGTIYRFPLKGTE